MHINQPPKNIYKNSITVFQENMRGEIKMAKQQAINFKDFMGGNHKTDEKKVIVKILATSGTIAVMTLPRIAAAATVNSTFGNVHKAIMNAFDAGVVLIIIFAGAAWGFNHRTKAIEILIGVCCGYILARHAVDIRDFLKGI
jgi:hypothetical protein